MSKGGGPRWVSAERLALAVGRSVNHRFGGSASERDRSAYVASLHLDDLALAAACIDGDESAWEHFVLELRPVLYAAARTIAGDEGRDLADSLYAELFGLAGAEGTRRSLLTYYHGRSRLSTWLRSVLVQRHIDRLRAAKRLQPLDEDEPAGELRATGRAADFGPEPDRERLVGEAQTALDAAIDALDPKDRLRLRLYYGQDLTLAAIGRLLGEHEATVSRKLERARRDLRAGVERTLAARGLGPGEIARAFELAAEAPELQMDRLLGQGDGV